jgi:hypothetical protein
MATKERPKHLSKKQRREEIMARANRARQQGGAGAAVTGPHGVGAPNATGSGQEVPGDRNKEREK